MDLIILSRYSFVHEAHIARAALESAGIAAFISDEHTISMNWLYSDLLGGVKLWIAKKDRQEALQILNMDYSAILEEELQMDQESNRADSPNDEIPATKKYRWKFVLILLLFLL